MFKTVLPRVSRAFPHNATASKRFLTTAPPHKTSRSWKNSAARWTLAGGLIYYYNTSNVFAEEPIYAIHSPPETSHETETYPSVDSIAEKRRAQARSQARSQAQVPSSSSANTTASVAAPELEGAAPGGPEDLEQEAGQQGAFNEETGEINWDCPCLGGMAHGPCGEQFREAFSCFVFSKDEPKGIDCIDKFKGMQDCFREHPDIYGAELEDDEEAPSEGVEAPAAAEGQAISSPEHAAGSPHNGGEKVSKPYGQDSDAVVAGKTERAEKAAQQVKKDHVPTSESETMVPKAWHSGIDADTEK